MLKNNKNVLDFYSEHQSMLTQSLQNRVVTNTIFMMFLNPIITYQLLWPLNSGDIKKVRLFCSNHSDQKQSSFDFGFSKCTPQNQMLLQVQKWAGSPVICQLEFWHRGLLAYGILSIHFRHTVFWQCMSIGISKVMITTWTVNCVNYCYFTNSGHLILLNVPYFVQRGVVIRPQSLLSIFRSILESYPLCGQILGSEAPGTNAVGASGANNGMKEGQT